MTELQNNQVEITLRYTGSEPEKAFDLARRSLTYKGFQFENFSKPIEYQQTENGVVATLIGTNQFLPEQPEKPKEERPVSSMNNAPLAISPEGVNE